jgi:Protein of unknown function (DUF2752)
MADLLKKGDPRGGVWPKLVIATGMAGLLYVMYVHDPEQGGFLFCPFRYITGVRCPGCGVQCATHDLLHGRLGEAFRHNALFVIAIPLGFVYWMFRGSAELRTRYGGDRRVLGACLALIAGWWVVRNVLGI